MADIYTKQKRSQIMSKISGNETKPEILVRKFLFETGFRFRKNDKRYSGKPDIVLPKHKTIIFIHGCFWHGHKCKAGKAPKNNKKFWKDKIGSNIERDRRNKSELKKQGWQVIIIWLCSIKTIEKRLKTLLKLKSRIMANTEHYKVMERNAVRMTERRT